MNRPSPNAAKRLFETLGDTDAASLTEALRDADEVAGETDCPNGCYVEPDGHCPHGYESAALTAGLI